MNWFYYIFCARLNRTSILGEYGLFGDLGLFSGFLFLCFLCNLYGICFRAFGFIAGLM